MADCTQNCPVAGRVDALEGQLDEYQAQNSATHKEMLLFYTTLEVYTNLGIVSTATYRQYFGNRTLYRMMLEKYREYGLLE